MEQVEILFTLRFPAEEKDCEHSPGGLVLRDREVLKTRIHLRALHSPCAVTDTAGATEVTPHIPTVFNSLPGLGSDKCRDTGTERGYSRGHALQICFATAFDPNSAISLYLFKLRMNSFLPISENKTCQIKVNHSGHYFPIHSVQKGHL